MKNIKHLSRKHIESLPKLTAPAGYVYVMQEMKYGEDFKIGKTRHPFRRCYEFGVQLPYEIKPVLMLRTMDASAAETILHRRFKKQRGKGEWFTLSESDLQRISVLNLDRMVKKQRRLAAKAKKKPKRAHRRVHFEDTGWSEADWTEEEWSDDESATDRDIDFDMWGEDEDYERHLATEDSDTILAEGDIEDSIEYENLSGKSLAGIIMSNQDLSRRDLSFGNLWGAELSYAYFVDSDLTAVDFTDAEMKGADLSNANLTNANLTGADLRRAKLVNANLQGAKLTAAKLSGAMLKGVTYDEFTILPNGKPWSAETDMTQFTR